MPEGVPASQVGKLLVNDTGDNLASWPRLTAYGSGGSLTHSGGVLSLSTTGGNRNGYSIMSPKTYTSGIFQARIYFPGASNGKIADWPAFWLSSAWSGAVSWPNGGEMDLAEGLNGNLSVTYHYGDNGTPEQTTSFGVTSAPGWHVVTGVWSTGRWDIYYDGKLVKTISGSYVVNDPMNIILSAYQGKYGNQPSVPSTVKVSSLQVWSLAG
jgi:beta-glucanase (GH16 family)